MRRGERSKVQIGEAQRSQVSSGGEVRSSDPVAEQTPNGGNSQVPEVIEKQPGRLKAGSGSCLSCGCLFLGLQWLRDRCARKPFKCLGIPFRYIWGATQKAACPDLQAARGWQAQG